MLGASLELGTWDLEFHAHAYFTTPTSTASGMEA
jgi:hypothetical protein